MLDIGFSELMVFAVIALVVLGPEKLPVAIRTAARYYVKIKNFATNIQQDIEKELNIAELKQMMQEEMERIKTIEQQMQEKFADLEQQQRQFAAQHSLNSNTETNSIDLNKNDLNKNDLNKNDLNKNNTQLQSFNVEKNINSELNQSNKPPKDNSSQPHTMRILTLTPVIPDIPSLLQKKPSIALSMSIKNNQTQVFVYHDRFEYYRTPLLKQPILQNNSIYQPIAKISSSHYQVAV